MFKVEAFICYRSLIVEVLSSTTQGLERGNKFTDFRSIETIGFAVAVGYSFQNTTTNSGNSNASGLWFRDRIIKKHY
jgi:hypothetical protein